MNNKKKTLGQWIFDVTMIVIGVASWGGVFYILLALEPVP